MGVSGVSDGTQCAVGMGATLIDDGSDGVTAEKGVTVIGDGCAQIGAIALEVSVRICDRSRFEGVTLFEGTTIGYDS